MKRLLLADSRNELLTTLEVILKHWGYRVLASSSPNNILLSLQTSQPELLIVGENLLHSPLEQLNRALEHLIGDPSTGVILLKDGAESGSQAADVPRLEVPVDLFVLFEYVQTYLEQHPRRNLRLTVNLPGMICQGERSNLAEVISVSNHGLFIKTTFQLGAGDDLRVVLPLIGMKKELDLPGKVIYRMEPNALNNYRQGVGIEFTNLGETEQRMLEDYLEKQFLTEISDSQRGPDLDTSQIRTHTEPLVRILKLT